MPVVFIVFSLLALLVFVYWERSRLQDNEPEPLSRDELANGWRPRTDPKLYGQIAVTFIVGIAAVSEWLNPGMPPFSGRMSTLKNAVSSVFGLHGIAAVWSCLAVYFGYVAYTTWKAARQAGGDVAR